jgi:hypothetical protein
MSDVPALTPETIRALLRECVTVVQPGETLIVQVGDTWTPRQVAAAHRELNWAGEDGKPYWPFRVLLVPGTGLGTAAAGTVHACPRGGSGGAMPCCGKYPAAVPVTDRITMVSAEVTCGGAR